VTDITGTFTEGGAGPVVGWCVELWYLDESCGWQRYSETVTDAGGNFAFSVPMIGIIAFDVSTVEVRLVDVVRRKVAWSGFELPITGTQPLGTITVLSANLRGWRATNLDPSGAAPRVSGNNTVQPMIDNATAWKALDAAVTGATKELALQLFYWDIGQVFLAFSPDPPSVGTPTAGARLEDDLVTASRSRGVTVRVLIRDHTPLPYPVHTADHVSTYFAGLSPATSIEVRRYWTDPRLPMHSKFVVIDGTEAHLTTSPFLQEYFDGQGHLVKDPRRGPLTSLGTVFEPLAGLSGLPWPLPAAVSLLLLQQYMKNSIRVPVHDVGAVIHGDAVKDLHDTFFLHWNVAGAQASSALTPAPPAAPVSTVQVVRSLPGETFPELPEGEASILESYLRCLARASDFIYLENQYLTERRIFDALRLALSDKTRPNLQIIVLMNHKVDIPLYQGWQTSRMTQLISNLTADGTIGRFGAYTLWSHDDTVTPTRIISTYVHTKAGIADDQWATIGSANLDGVSLMTGEHLAPVFWTPGQENRRATEVNVTVVDGLDGAGPSTVPADLRRTLWAEHLGLSGPADPLLATRPAGGWLSLWQARAGAKLSSLTEATPVCVSSRVLAWKEPKKSEKYLQALGVDTRKLNVLEEFPGFDFGTGNWQ
jgi:phosphatidylserine/phosphatidylglycerophosphate/cardiolipin synthase-like enzyme